jgi:hypothetical protein
MAIANNDTLVRAANVKGINGTNCPGNVKGTDSQSNFVVDKSSIYRDEELASHLDNEMQWTFSLIWETKKYVCGSSQGQDGLKRPSWNVQSDMHGVSKKLTRHLIIDSPSKQNSWT